MTCPRVPTRGATLRSPGARLVLLSAIAGGCTVGPEYERPVVESPPIFRAQPEPPAPASLADQPWWEVFRDEALQGLIREALASNFDLAIAASRVEQARAIADQARARYFPFVGYQGGIADGRNTFLGVPNPNGGQTHGSAIVAVSAAWEVDIWGRIRRLNEAAQSQYLATEEARRGVTLSLVSEVAQAYFELLELELELQIARDAVASFTDSLRIFTQRFEGGVASKVETTRAAAALASASASVPELERRIALKENQISVLLGRNPAPVARGTALVSQVTPPDVPAGIPSALLVRRPDIRQAEQFLRAACAAIGVAEADFFPKFNLTALLGQVSADLSTFANGSSAAWGIAAGLVGPIFEGGRLNAQLAQAKAVFDEARLQYQFTALIAFREVADSLTSREKLAQTRVEQERAVAAYEEAVSVARQRYLAGKASYFEVLDAQLELFPAQDALAQTRLSQLLVIVQLYKSLGGGWNLSDAEWAGPTAPASDHR